MSSRKTRHQSRGVLSPAKAEEILKGLANIPDSPPAGTVISRSPLPIEVKDRSGRRRLVATSYRHIASIERMREDYPQIFENCSESDMRALRHLLREAWMSPDPRDKEWFCFSLRRFHAEVMRLVQTFTEDDGKTLLQVLQGRNSQINSMLERAGKAGSRFTPAQQSYHILYGELYGVALKERPVPMNDFETIAFHLQRNLHRALYCPNPECQEPYFFANKKGQKFCSPECARPARLESQRRWWRDNRGKRK